MTEPEGVDRTNCLMAMIFFMVTLSMICGAAVWIAQIVFTR